MLKGDRINNPGETQQPAGQAAGAKEDETGGLWCMEEGLSRALLQLSHDLAGSRSPLIHALGSTLWLW